MSNLPKIKGPCSRILPPFHFSELADVEVDFHRVFACYEIQVTNLPVVIAISSDRLNVFTDKEEIKYDPFSEDYYSRVIGSHDALFRQYFKDLVIYGYIGNNRLDVFNIWNINKKQFCDVKYTDKINFYPSHFIDTLQSIIEKTWDSTSDGVYTTRRFVKNISDPDMCFWI